MPPLFSTQKSSINRHKKEIIPKTDGPRSIADGDSSDVSNSSFSINLKVRMNAYDFLKRVILTGISP